METLKLLCLPYAGASVSIYNDWIGEFDSSIEVILIELAGRGKRYSEDLYKNMQELVDDIYEKSITLIGDSRFAFFGYSMGSNMAFELAQKYQSDLGRAPEHIFFAACDAPSIPNKSNIGSLSDYEFREMIINLGGIPKEICSNLRALDCFMPIIKSDYMLNSNYVLKNAELKVESDISILYGSNDEEIELNNVNEWSKYTKKNCCYYEFDGSHFFINDYKCEIIKLVNKKLKKYCKE